MKIAGYAENYQPMTESFPYPYIASLSRVLRMAKDIVKADMRIVVEPIIKDFETMPELIALKETPSLPDGRTIWRQVDIKDGPDGEIGLKCFVCWHKEMNCWHAFLEGANERDFEDGGDNLYEWPR